MPEVTENRLERVAQFGNFSFRHKKAHFRGLFIT